MNPRTNFDEVDAVTARAFFNLFKTEDFSFKFGRDNPDSDEELRASLIPTDNHDNNGDSTIVITAIDMENRFNLAKEKVEDMNLEIIEEKQEECSDEHIGEYTAYTLACYADEESSGSNWNTPHLVFYGSLYPEIEECISGLAGSFSFADVRNHVLVWGEDVDENIKGRLRSEVNRCNFIPDEEARYTKSNITKGSVI